MSPLSSLLSRGNGAETDDAVEGAGHAAPVTRPDVVVRVNLLPAEIEEAASFRRGQIVRGGVVAAAVALVAGGGVLASQSVSSAQSDLDAERATATRLAAQVEALSAVPQTQAQLASAQTRLAGAMSQQVRWSTYLNALGMVVPRDVSFDEVAITQPVDLVPPGSSAAAQAAVAAGTPAGAAAGVAAGAAAGAAGAATQLVPTGVTSVGGNVGVATVTFTAQAKEYTDIAALLNRLARYDANIDPYFSSSSKTVDSASERKVVSFSATTTVTDQALTHEFDQKGQ